MKSLRVKSIVLLIAVLATATWAQEEETDKAPSGTLDPRDMVSSTKISLREAIGVALKATSGHAVEAELTGEASAERQVMRYEVVVLNPHQQLVEVTIDAVSGAVLGRSLEDGEDEELEARDHRWTLRHCQLPLSELVARAEGLMKGFAVAAQLEMDSVEDGPTAEIRMVNGAHVIEIDVEARGGTIIDLELLRDPRPSHAHREAKRGEDDEAMDEEEEEEHEKASPRGNRHEEEEEEEEERENASPRGKQHEDKRSEASDARSAPSVAPHESGPAYFVAAPLAEGKKFSAVITHPYLPLSETPYARLEGEHQTVVREVLSKPVMVAGIACLVLIETEKEGGELKEISRNYFAQDEAGNVYYFGEDVDEYENGKIVSHGGSWLVGRDVKEPCLFMPVQPKPGFRFMRENAPPEIHEYNEIEAKEGTLSTPAGSFSLVLIVKDGDEPGVFHERKYYGKGVGLLSENKTLNLVEIRLRK